jgi:polysaccharide biosynthesis transport protein
MELKQYLYIIQRWAWLLALGVILGAGGGYGLSLYQTPIYQASTKLMFNRPADDKVNDLSYLTNQQLAQTYIQLLSTQPVLDAASKKLGYTVSTDQINTSLVRDSQLIQVTVEDSNPTRSAIIANTMIQVLIEQNDKLQTSRFASSEDSLQVQLKQVEGQIASLQADISQVSQESYLVQKKQIEDEIKKLENDILKVQQEISVIEPPQPAGAILPIRPTLSPAQNSLLQEKQLRLDQSQSSLQFYQQIYLNLVGTGKSQTGVSTENSRLDQMNNTLALYQQIYSNLLSSYEDIRLSRMRTTPNMVQVEAAVIPSSPIRPQPLTNTGLGGIVGLIIVVGIISMIEYLDDTIKTPEEVRRLFGLTVIGYIGEMSLERDNRDIIYVSEEPRSPISEAFRSLRANLEFAGPEAPLRTLLVTSANPSEGKTTISINLATVLAQGGKQVVLVDADLRRPHVHKFFGLSNRVGLSDILIKHLSIQTVARTPKEDSLTIVTSGSLPPNPSELLTSNKMDQFIDAAREQSDVVILDSPPFLISDASVLAARVDGVVLVVQPGHTHIDSIRVIIEQMERVGARVLGIIFNRIPRNRGYYYGGYRHYRNNYYRSGKSFNGYYFTEDKSKKSRSKNSAAKNTPTHPVSNSPRVQEDPRTVESKTTPRNNNN